MVLDIVFLLDNKYMYVVDMMNGCVWILWYDMYEVFGSFGCSGCYLGQFIWFYSVVVDS